MLAKAMRGVELNGWLIAGAGRDSDVVRNVGVEDVPDKRRCEAATDMRRKDDEGADVNVTWAPPETNSPYADITVTTEAWDNDRALEAKTYTARAFVHCPRRFSDEYLH